MYGDRLSCRSVEEIQGSQFTVPILPLQTPTAAAVKVLEDAMRKDAEREDVGSGKYDVTSHFSSVTKNKRW